jgi:hypothetical protein
MNNKKLSGQIPPIILILIGGVIVTIIIIIAIFIITQKPKPAPVPEELEKKGPVLEMNLGDIKIKLVRVEDVGNILLSSAGRNPSSARDATTAEKFIKVTVSAENIGKSETNSGEWDIGEVIDGEGRKFPYYEKFNNWLPSQNGCRSSLKPGFTPVLCTKIYEVAKISKDLRIKLISGKNSLPGIKDAFIDLGL